MQAPLAVLGLKKQLFRDVMPRTRLRLWFAKELEMAAQGA